MNVDISVIIPTYNRKHLLGHTLNSILYQDLPPYEIIVVDDHSTDGTYEWLKEQFPSVMALTNQGKGPGAARNTGLRHATGNYIQFFDSDDLMTPNKLQVQSVLLAGKCDTFIYGPYAIATAYPDEWKLIDAIMQFYPLPDDNLLRWVHRGWCSITQACLFPKQLIDKVGYWKEDISTHEDREYWYRIAQAISSSPIHENLTCTIYRQHGAQLTLASQKMLQRAYDSLKVDSIIEKQCKYSSLISFVYLKCRIASTLAYINNLQGKKSSINIKINSFVHRMLHKFGRVRTRTNWQPMHGAVNDKDIFERMIRKMNHILL